jgi:NADH-quinone oxidoreductase subunit M
MIALSIFILPLLSGLVLLNSPSIPSRKIASGIGLTMTLLVTVAWIRLAYGITDEFHLILMERIGFNASFQMSGPSTAMALLTSLAAFLIPITSFSSNQVSAHRFYGWMMIMIGAMMGAFITTNALFFYLCYELALIPIFFIMLKWGHGQHLVKIVTRFFLYTLFGSLFMLLSMLYVQSTMEFPSFELVDMIKAANALSAQEQGWVFAGFFIAFAVKMPVFPFHSWQPSTYDHSPIQGTMMLAAVMLKMATFGLAYWVLPMVPKGISEHGQWAVVLSVISVVYASLMAINQKRFKMLIAYSSVAHVGMISAGLLSNTDQGTIGGYFEMFSHGLLAIALFSVYSIINHRIGHDQMNEMGGIRTTNPTFAFLFFILVMGSVALPFTSGFVGEFLLIQGLSHISLVWAGIAGLSVILGAAYMLRGFQKMMLGSAATPFAALTREESWMLGGLVLTVIVLGIYPAPLLNLIQMTF